MLVRIEAALTDGTDAKCYLRGHPMLLATTPSPFGHEYAGTVAAVGAGAPFAVGDRVAGANSAPCDACARRAARGARSCAASCIPLLNGAYAEYLLVPARIARAQPVRAAGGRRAGRRRDVRAAGLRAARRRGDRGRAGDRVCVLGRGALGQMLAAALAARGCDVVSLRSTDPDPDGGVRPRDRGGGHAGGVGARGAARGAGRDGGAVRRARRRHVVPVDAYRLHYEALTLRGVFHHAPAARARGARRAGARDPAPFRALITHEFALDDVVVPLEMTAGIRPRDGILKAVADQAA